MEKRTCDNECSICLREFQLQDKTNTLPCQHVFHNSCVIEWFKNKRTCPLCRSDTIKPYKFNKNIEFSDIQGIWINSNNEPCIVENKNITFLRSGKDYEITETENTFVFYGWVLKKESNTFTWQKENGDTFCNWMKAVWEDLPVEHRQKETVDIMEQKGIFNLICSGEIDATNIQSKKYLEEIYGKTIPNFNLWLENWFETEALSKEQSKRTLENDEDADVAKELHNEILERSEEKTKDTLEKDEDIDVISEHEEDDEWEPEEDDEWEEDCLKEFENRRVARQDAENREEIFDNLLEIFPNLDRKTVQQIISETKDLEQAFAKAEIESEKIKENLKNLGEAVDLGAIFPTIDLAIIVEMLSETKDAKLTHKENQAILMLVSDFPQIPTKIILQIISNTDKTIDIYEILQKLIIYQHAFPKANPELMIKIISHSLNDKDVFNKIKMQCSCEKHNVSQLILALEEAITRNQYTLIKIFLREISKNDCELLNVNNIDIDDESDKIVDLVSNEEQIKQSIKQIRKIIKSALDNKNMKMVHALLDYQFGNHIVDDYFGMTLLMYAIHTKNYEMTKLFLCCKQIDCMNHLKLNNGESIWKAALNTRNEDIIKLLAAEASMEIKLIKDTLKNDYQFRDEEMQRILHNVLKEKNKKKSCFLFCSCSCDDNKKQETIHFRKE